MLNDRLGNRKYLTARERRRFIEIAGNHPAAMGTFRLTLAYIRREAVCHGREVAGYDTKGALQLFRRRHGAATVLREE